MRSIKVKKANGSGDILFHRLESGNDVVTTNENKNIFYGSIDSAPDTADMVIDGNNYYYKSKDINNNIKWQKMYLRGEDNG